MMQSDGKNLELSFKFIELFQVSIFNFIEDR